MPSVTGLADRGFRAQKRDKVGQCGVGWAEGKFWINDYRVHLTQDDSQGRMLAVGAMRINFRIAQ